MSRAAVTSATYPPDRLTIEAVTRAIRGDASYAVLSASDTAGRRVADLLGEVDARRRQLLGQLPVVELRASMRA